MNRQAWTLVAIVAGISIWLFFFMKKSGVLNFTSLNLSADQQSMAQLIAHLATLDGYSDHVAFLQAEALEESSLNPAAKSKANSYGMFQIYHAANFSWLRVFGYHDADLDRLYDPTFNTTLAIRIFRYFESRGFVFPAQADIYNMGETAWAAGKRNEDYRRTVVDYTAQFTAALRGV